MRLQEILDRLRQLAPEHLAEPWDHPGLHLGDPAWRVSRAMLCIDLTQPVLQEAVAQRANLIVAYHPPIFTPLVALTSLEPNQQVILAAARHKIAVYSPHTALDAVKGGVNDWLCDGLGVGERWAITPHRAGGGPSDYKVVTFVPQDHADRLRDALAKAGAGRIGGYTQCSFNLQGQGTFLGGVSTNPTVGQAGRLERVAETRLEMVCPTRALTQVVFALRHNHPYEEPAFDVYPLEPPPPINDAPVGQGRVMTLNRPVSAATLIKRVKSHLGQDWLDVAMPKPLSKKKTQIKQVGVCAGAGGSILNEAKPIDAFLTGEMRHHDILEAQAKGIMVMLAGHTQTERPYLKVYRQHLTDAGGKSVQWTISKADQPPLRRR